MKKPWKAMKKNKRGVFWVVRKRDKLQRKKKPRGSLKNPLA